MRLSDYGTSLSGMMAAQSGIATTKQNISNMQTEGYVRQKVNLNSMGPSKGVDALQLVGYGVNVAGIERVTDTIKREQYNSQLSTFSYYEYKATNLADVESLLGGTGDSSLSTLMDGFFQSWSDVAKNPNQRTIYSTLVSNTTKFTTQLNRIASSLSSLQSSVTEDLQRNVDKFNTLSTMLAETNKQIGQAGFTTPNSLLDKRDQLLAEMSKYAKIDISYESQNVNIATVRIDGQSVVSGNESYKLAIVTEGGESKLQLGGIDVEMGQGTIQAALEVSQTMISGYKEKLDLFATELMNRINAVIQPAFFTGSGAGDIRVNPDIEKNLGLLTVTADAANTIAGIADETLQNGEGLTYSKYLDGFVIGVAADVNLADSYQNVHNDLLTSLQQNLASVEGVNMDEEMVNLMMYQNYFAANSKAIRTLDEMYDSLFALI